MSTDDNYGIGDPLIPSDVQNVSQTVKMKGTEVSFLSKVEAPTLYPSLEQHVDYECPIDCNFGVHSKFSVLPNI